MEENVQKRSKGFEKFLQHVEIVGNKIPHPVSLFIYLSIAVILLSFICAKAGLSAINPATGKEVVAFNLLSVDGFIKMLTQAVNNFTTLPALGLVLVCMMGVGLCDHSGLFNVALKGLVERSNASDTKIIAIFCFLCVMADCTGGAGFVVMPPLGAIIWASMRRNPMAGMFAAYASVSGAFASNLMITSMDVVNVSFTETAAQLVNPQYTLSPAINWYFSAFSVPVLTIVSVLITIKFVEPHLGKYNPAYADSDNDSSDSATSEQELKALKSAGISLVIFVAVVVALLFSGILNDPKTGSAIASSAPFMKGLTVLIAFMFGIPGAVYGLKCGKFHGIAGIAEALGKTMAGMGGYIALMFFIAQFLSYFSWSNLGIIFAINGSVLLKSSGLPIWLVLVLFVIMCMIINLLIGSASTKWAILAPVFVPMFMLLGYHPALIQMAYRIGDAITNPICPTFAYFGMLVALAQRYDKRSGFGTLIANMLPYSIAFFAFMMVQLLAWFFLGIPFGPGAPLLLN